MTPLFQTKNSLDVAGWLTALILPAFFLYFLQETKLNWACINFIVIFTAALIMWIFRLVPEYAPAFFIIVATILLGLAPQSVLLSGFSSDSFFLALSIFGIGAVLVKSRFFYRLSLIILIHLPKNKWLLQSVLFGIGTLLTPVMTAQSARVSLILPLLEDVRKTAGLKPNSIAANGLACAAFNGCILLSVIFLTGKSSNFVLYGMMSEQIQWQFSWLTWLEAASVPGLMMIILFFIMLKVQFRSNDAVEVNHLSVKQELLKLGRVTFTEWSAILSISMLILSLIFSSWHQIPTTWVSFAIFCALLTSGFLDKNDFKNGINWPFLFYLGAIIGIMRCVQEIGIDTWIMHYLSWLTHIANEQHVLFLIIIYMLSWIGCLFFGTTAAPAILFAILLPVTAHASIHIWLVAFVILMATEGWVFPYQSSYYLLFEEWTKESQNYEPSSILRINAVFSLLRLLIILLSIPFWRSYGLL